jgi:hypothetical protein
VSTDSTVRIEWHGDEVKGKALDGTRRAMDRVMAECVTTAMELVGKKTAGLSGSLRMQPTVRQGNSLTGMWGSYGMKHAIYQEFGTGTHAEGGSRGPYIIRPRRRKALWWEGLEHPVRSVVHPGIKPHPFLRPSADRNYPKLRGYIREEYTP